MFNTGILERITERRLSAKKEYEVTKKEYEDAKKGYEKARFMIEEYLSKNRKIDLGLISSFQDSYFLLSRRFYYYELKKSSYFFNYKIIISEKDEKHFTDAKAANREDYAYYLDIYKAYTKN